MKDALDRVVTSEVTVLYDLKDSILTDCDDRDPIEVSADDAEGSCTGTLRDHTGEGSDFEANDVATKVVKASEEKGVTAEVPDS